MMLIDLVMVTPPNPPGSSTLISPPAAVFEIAPANVLHGAVRLHGLASSPTPETHVRVAWAWASAVMLRQRTDKTMTLFIPLTPSRIIGPERKRSPLVPQTNG